jgi:sulfoxide reductase heme-binding subunit YedZ
MSNELLRPLRIAVFFALLIPAAMLAHDYYVGALASPFRTIVQETGTWSIRLLVLGLLIGPLRDVTGWQWPLALRRMIGLYAAFYAAVHLVAWTRQYGFDWPYLFEEATHLWLLVGLGAVLALVPLAATSATIMHRLLGPAAWGRVHKLVYAAAILAVIHYAMARGLTRSEMVVDAILIAVALLWRRFAPKRPPVSAAARPSSPA